MQIDTLIMSDFHLGSSVSKTEKILKVLEDGQFKTLIINGDLIDCHNLKRFKKEHWKVLSRLRKLTKSHKVIFVGGNHDGDIEIVSLILGLEFVSEFKFEIAGKKFLAVHGHESDTWVKNFPLLTEIFTGLYYLIQKCDTKNKRISGFLKHKSKTWLKVHKSMRNKAFEKAKKFGVNGIFFGHSHLADEAMQDGIVYMNSGSFSESPCHYITIDSEGNCKLMEI